MKRAVLKPDFWLHSLVQVEIRLLTHIEILIDIDFRCALVRTFRTPFPRGTLFGLEGWPGTLSESGKGIC